MGGAGRARRISPAVRAWSGDLQNKHLTHWVARDSESGTRGGGGERERERRKSAYLAHAG
jgi:hypothetical protein